MKIVVEKQGHINKYAGVNVPRSTLKLLALTGGFCCLFLLTILLVSVYLNTPVGTFTRDPLQVVNAPFYTGLVSNLGILFWCATAAICLYSYSLSYKYLKEASFLLFSGILTLFILADDFFLLHEVVYRNYAHIPQRVVFSLYILSTAYILYTFRKVILNTGYIILYTAIFMFVLSGVIDAIPQNILPAHHLFEDGTKFIGIVFWFLYFLRTSALLLTNHK